MRFFRLFSVLPIIAILSACSTLSSEKPGSVSLPQEIEIAETRAATLAVEVSRLESENARLANIVLDLQRENEALQIIDDRQVAAEVEPDAATAIGLPPAPEIDVPDPEPRNKIIVEDAKAQDLKIADVPVESAPRLVQPSFAATEAVFENEAEGEIQTSSVLFGVHLASYRKMEEARLGWEQLQRENPNELGLLEPRIETIEIAGKGTFMRLIGGGFSSTEKAAALCANLKGKGVFCAVSGFAGDRLARADAG